MKNPPSRPETRRVGAPGTTGHPWLLFVFLFACALVLGLMSGTASARAHTRRLDRRRTPDAAHPSIYWGATIGSQITGEAEPADMRAVSVFSRNARKAPSIVHFFYPLAHCSPGCHGLGFPTSSARHIRSTGAIPLITWMGDANGSPAFDPTFSLSSVLSGRWDATIRRFALGAKRWGEPFFLRVDPEMNGNWLPWGAGTAGNRAAEFAQAWRHIYDIFQSVGTHNATWVWCPMAGSSRGVRAEYPGNRYVGWTCLDGYNWGTNPNGTNTVNEWRSFTQIFRSSYHELLRLAPAKPIMIGEVATSAWGGSKARWLRTMLSVVPRHFPHIHALVYFDIFQPGGMDWSLETGPSDEASFAAGVDQPAYVGNSFRTLKPGPIPVPR